MSFSARCVVTSGAGVTLEVQMCSGDNGPELAVGLSMLWIAGERRCEASCALVSRVYGIKRIDNSRIPSTQV